ncbi:MAG: hypothetical protein CFH06_00431 [Alphaproteobacteria bacterium MarineAlpha3_Bin5]|nr:MAG: hypothetical protein CFH06_00431 [Alphaproteobacteria bacterium MarineAlpha3_Bin5]
MGFCLYYFRSFLIELAYIKLTDIGLSQILATVLLVNEYFIYSVETIPDKIFHSIAAVI